MAKSPSEVLLDTVVKEQVTSVLKPAGFKKKAMWFRREHGQTQQVERLVC